MFQLPSVTAIVVAINLIATLTSALLFFNAFRVSDKTKHAVIGFFATVTMFILIAFALGTYDLFTAHIKDWFLPGHVAVEEVFVEGDGETVDHYEDEYSFVPDRKIAVDVEGAIDLLVQFIFIGCFVLHYYFYAHTNKQDGDDGSKTDFSPLLYISIAVIISITLVLCLLPMPRGYYNYIRVSTCLGTIFLMTPVFRRQLFVPYAMLLIIALLFNPIYWVHFSRVVWNVIDVVVAMLYCTAAVKEYIDYRYYNG